MKTRIAIIVLALVAAGCASTGGEYSNIGYEGGGEDAKFIAAEEGGVKRWQGSDTIDLKNRTKPLTLKVINSLNAEHGFSIDTMKVEDVLKPNEEKVITIPLENIDPSVTQ